MIQRNRNLCSGWRAVEEECGVRRGCVLVIMKFQLVDYYLNPSHPQDQPLYRTGVITELISTYYEDHEILLRGDNGKLGRSMLCTHGAANHKNRAVLSSQSHFPLCWFCISKAKGFAITTPSPIPVFHPICLPWDYPTIPSHQCWDNMSNI